MLTDAHGMPTWPVIAVLVLGPMVGFYVEGRRLYRGYRALREH